MLDESGPYSEPGHEMDLSVSFVRRPKVRTTGDPKGTTVNDRRGDNRRGQPSGLRTFSPSRQGRLPTSPSLLLPKTGGRSRVILNRPHGSSHRPLRTET